MTEKFNSHPVNSVRFDLLQDYSIEEKFPIKTTHFMCFFIYLFLEKSLTPCLPASPRHLDSNILRSNIHSRSHSTWKIRRPVATAAYYLIFTNFNNSLYLHQRLEPTYLQAIIVKSLVLDLKNYFQVSLHG